MLRLLLMLLAAIPASAEDSWEMCRLGPLEVWTSGSGKPARELLVRMEQLRFVVGTMLGKKDPSAVWSFRVLVPKGKTPAASWRLGRDAWVSIVPAGTQPSRQWMRELARMLLEANARRMPAEWENGLLDLWSTLDAVGPKITLSAPPAAERNLDWARVYLLATNPEYATRFRVLLNNLQQGADEAVAFPNSLGQPKAEIEKTAAAYFAAGQFAPFGISGRAISERDFQMIPVETPKVMAALSDATGNPKLNAPGSLEAAEALGLDAAAGRAKEAQEWLTQAVASGSQSARVHLAYALGLTDLEKKRKAITEAGKLNARWPEPYIELANTETTASRQAYYLKGAAQVDPRNSALWQRLAKSQLEAGEFSDASKSWFAAEMAAPTAGERAQVRQARLAFEEERAAREAAEKKRIADERERELDRLKQEALNRVREAEAKANRGQTAADPNRKVETWWDDGKPTQRVSGVLEKVDCMGRQARIWIRPSEGKPTAYWIQDPGQIVIIGGGEAALGCGVQKPARSATVEFRPRPAPKTGTAGDVTLVEFR